LVFNIDGPTPTLSFEHTEIEAIQKVVHSTLGGVIHTTKAFLPMLKLADKSCIINVASLESFLALPGNPLYCMYQFALRGLSESLLLESSSSYPNVQISCVYAGLNRTSFAVNSKPAEYDYEADDSIRRNIDSTKLLETLLQIVARISPHEAAKHIVYELSNGNNRILIGKDLRLIEFAVRMFPTLWHQSVPLKLIILLTLLSKPFGKKTLFLFAALFLYTKRSTLQVQCYASLNKWVGSG
jgi:short-subunit dehydrogenase